MILANDITERLQVQAQLERYAFSDTLTGLLNRTGFSRNLQQAIARNQDENHPFTLLYLSLDGFIRLKFSLGHPVARQLLIEAANRLKACFPRAIAARLEDNEFALRLRYEVDSVDAVVGHLRDRLTSVYHLNDHDVFSDCSIGVVRSNLGYADAEDYLQAGDTPCIRRDRLCPRNTSSSVNNYAMLPSIAWNSMPLSAKPWSEMNLRSIINPLLIW